MSAKCGNIPAELREHKGWLTWKKVAQKGSSKPLKMPHYCHTGKWRKGIQGSQDDRKGLVTFKEAVHTLKTSEKGYTGLGLAMLPDWNLVAVDFDDCVESGKVDPRVEALVMPTYWEFSPSGNGIRAFFFGALRDGKSITKEAKASDNRAWGVEFFHAKGFVTVTGNLSPAVELIGADIVPLTDEIKALHAKVIGNHGSTGSTGNADQPPVGMTDEEIKRMLEQWDSDCDYETWVRVGMAIHHETQGEGFDLWNDWSMQGGDYAGQEQCEYKWESFGRQGKIALKTIRWMINEKPLDFSLENVGNDDFQPLVGVGEPGGAKLAAPHLERNGNGQPNAVPYNVVTWLKRPDMSGVEVAYDTFLDEVVIRPAEHHGGGSWQLFTDDDYTRLRCHFDQRGFKPVGAELVRSCVSLVARENEVDVARQWIEGLKWDGVPRCENFLRDYFGVEDNEFHRAVSMYAWAAHAGRCMDKDVKADAVIVLVGEQMRGKSESLKAIAPSPDYFTDNISFSQRDADTARLMRGKLVVEVPELKGLSGADSDAVKAFITRTVEEWTPKYKEKSIKFFRRFVFWASTNDTDFLSDPTGNRRWFPVWISGGQREKIEKDRDQLWAEARTIYQDGGVAMRYSKAVSLAKESHDRFRHVDEWEDIISEFLDEMHSSGKTWGELNVIQRKDVYARLGVPECSRNRTTQSRLKKIFALKGRIDGRAKNEQGRQVRGFVKKN